MKRIILNMRKAPDVIQCNTVKLTDEAVRALGRMQLRTGMTARQLASQIICQAECLVTVVDCDPASCPIDEEEDS